MGMELRHSGMGIASFVISLVGAAAMLALFVVAGMIALSTPGGVDEESMQAMVLGAMIVALFAVELVALGLGIAGVVQRGRRKAFAVLGLVFAGATLVGTTVLLAAGSAMPD